MSRVQKLRIEPLTAEAFGPCGEIVGITDRSADYQAGGGLSRGWEVGFETAGKVRVTVSQTVFGGLTFAKLERHFSVTQTFIPLGGSPAVVAVAAPTDPRSGAAPKPEDVRAFLIDGSKGYLMRKGTWHSLARFPLYGPSSTFLVLSDEETWQDLELAYSGKGGWRLTDEVDYGEKFGVTFELVL